MDNLKNSYQSRPNKLFDNPVHHYSSVYIFQTYCLNQKHNCLDFHRLHRPMNYFFIVWFISKWCYSHYKSKLDYCNQCNHWDSPYDMDTLKLFILIDTMYVDLIFLPSLHSANSLLHTSKQSLSLQLPAQLIKSVSHNEVQVRLRS